MKTLITPIKSRFFVAVLAAGLGLILVGHLTAQTFTALYSFTGGVDEGNPYGGLVVSGDTLYGTTIGGSCCAGTVFSVKTNGTGLSVLHYFDYGAGGAGPQGGLVLSGNTLYGTAAGGGGTVFSLKTYGADFTVLYTLAGLDGSSPTPGLTLADSTLYGTTVGDHTGNNGTVFSVNTNGTGFTVLHTMTTRSVDYPFTNVDGSLLYCGLALSGDTLYGTADSGGDYGNGTVFSVKTNGTGFAVLHAFTSVSSLPPYANVDGSHPEAGLLVSGGALYGTTTAGGNGNGTVFSVKTDGTGFTVLRKLSVVDGQAPRGELVLSGSRLYGTTRQGGVNNNGTVFSIKTNGTSFTVLHAFTARFAGGGGIGPTNFDGASPVGGLVLSGNMLYGLASEGGVSGYGTVFSSSIPVPPSPHIIGLTLAGTNLVVNATNGVAGEIYSVLMSADLSSPLSQWTSVATKLLTGSGNFTITATNAVDPNASQRFYILQMK